MNDRLLRARLRAQLSQTELAERAGLSLSSVNAYERGRANPRPLTLAKLAVAMGLEPTAFLDAPETANV